MGRDRKPKHKLSRREGKDLFGTGGESLQRRLDNIVYRLGLARTRPQARQFVTHGLVRVNGKRVNIPSYLV